MSYRRPKKRPPFVKLPRHKRSHEVVLLKGKIQRDTEEYGGRFTSHLVLNVPGHDLYNQSFHFYFTGTDRFTIWNAEIITARKAFWEAASDLAYKRANTLLTPVERGNDWKLEFESAQVSSTGKVLTYRQVKREPVRYAQFGGLTFPEQWRKLESEIVQHDPPAIFESFKLDHKYAYGIGLSIVLDVPVIDQAAIECSIDRFLSVGETNWKSIIPVPNDQLPKVSENEALAELKYSTG